MIDSLPVYSTTSAFEDRAILKIKTMNHALLKVKYEEIFQREWEQVKDEFLTRFGIVSWEEWNQEGTASRLGTGPEFRSGAHTGGLTIRFLGSDGTVLGYIWMRGSGTEPVFRVLADWKGNNRDAEPALLDWHKKIITLADEACG